jgi:beta-glucosidase
MRAVTAGFLLATSAVLAQQPVYSQCGGIGWNGGTTCATGSVCTAVNDYYWQCLPGTGSTTSTTTTTTTTTTPGGGTTTTRAATPTSNVSPAWQSALAKASSAVSKLSLADKVNLATGTGWQNGKCVGNILPISSIGFPGLCLEDGPVGVRSADLVSVFPAAINVAATFSRTLMQQRGSAMGAEFRGKGVNAAMGPMMNLMRAPAAGRNWEGFGGDAYLSGEGAYETITGMQSQGVQACAKHLIDNEQEHFRDSSSSNVDDRTQHEAYARPFLRSVQANVASIMCSYNQINGSYACENDKVLNGIVKNEFGFPGYIVSDWWATHSTLSVNSGLDMTMPGDISLGSGTTYFGQNLINAVNSGSVSQTRINDMATRILAAWYLVGQDSGYPATNFNSWNLNDGSNKHVNVQADHKNLIRTIGAASTILLKNTNNALPLSKPASIAVVGNGAGPSSKGPNGYGDRAGDDGVLAVGWGSGTADFPYLITPLDAIKAKATSSAVTSSLSDSDLNAAASAASGKSVALVFITADSGEGYLTVEGNVGDRNDLKAWHNGDALVAKVASVNKNTIVVVNSVGPIVMEPWITNSNITAVVWSGLPGQEAGNSLVDILFGAYNPSGRLPFTIGKSINDYAAKVLYSGSGVPAIPYSEGLFIDYKHFDKNNIEPRFEFGFGLSYTTFAYSAISVSGSTSGGTQQPVGAGSSLDPWLHTAVVTVSFTLKNTGTLAGSEVPQLYISLPSSANSPVRELRGFDNVSLAASASTTVSFKLTRFDFAIWSVSAQRWQIPSGTATLSVGPSSRNLPLKTTISL